MITASDLHRVAPTVWDRLKALGALPPQGTVAGQAVASLFYEELGLNMRGAINDIDVFVDLSLPRTQRGKSDLAPHTSDDDLRNRQSRKTNNTACVGQKVSVQDDDYEHVKFIALRNTLKICGTYKAELMNYTLIDASGLNGPKTPSSVRHSKAVSQELVNGFDLNAVAVGINCTSQEVVFSDAFLEFCNTQVLAVQMCNTPAHTLVRLAKKYWGQEITHVACDFAQQRELLEWALQCQAQNNNTTTQTVTAFGKKYAALAQQYAAHLPALTPVKPQWWSKEASTGDLYTFALPSPEPNSVCAYLCDRVGKIAYQLFVLLYLKEFPHVHHVLRGPSNANTFAQRHALLNALEMGLRGDVLENAPAAQKSGDQWVENACAVLLPPADLNVSSVYQRHHISNAYVYAPNDETRFAHALNWLQKALGRPDIVHDIPPLNATESAVFFFEQDVLRNPLMMEEVRATCARLSEQEWALVRALQWKADDVLRWRNDPRAQLNRVLDTHDWAMLVHALDKENVNAPTQDLFVNELRQALVARCTDTPPTPTSGDCVRAQRLLSASTCIMIEMTSTDKTASHKPYVQHVEMMPVFPLTPWISKAPRADRTQALADLWAIAFPETTKEQTDVETVAKVSKMMLSACAVHDICPPPILMTLWDGMSAQERHAVLLLAVRALPAPAPSEYSWALKNGLWGQWFAQLPDDQLATGHAVLLRLLVAKGGIDVVQQRLSVLPVEEQNQMAHAIQAIWQEDEEEKTKKHCLLGSDRLELHPNGFDGGSLYRESVCVHSFAHQEILQQLNAWCTSLALRAATATPSSPAFIRSKKM